MSTASQSADPRAEQAHGLFHDALADWTNDDVLQTKEARAALRARHPASLRVLDWPELRALFAKYDPPATRHSQRDRRLGLLSVAVAALGLGLAALSPLAVRVGPVIEVVAAALVLAGLAIMAVHRFGAASKARALAHRFAAERARALYFQAVVNNLDLASRAIADDEALGQWKAARARLLADLPQPDDLAALIPQLAGPVGDDAEAWVSPAWSAAPEPPQPSAELDLLLSLLRGQRLNTQIDYVERKLSASLGAPGQRAAVVRWLRRLLRGAAVAAAVVAVALVAAMGRAPRDPDVKLALEVAVGAIVAAAALSVVNDDRLLGRDAARYAAYLAALSNARARFDTGGPAEKLAALREVETICYRDLRAFVGGHWRSG
ncbi:MAG: hypothetical protein JF588_01795 [Caulobacterales bacterium]|nr:hypothetical protein [Caulobacterales bacterium]